jgi:hypothetical protein
MARKRLLVFVCTVLLGIASTPIHAQSNTSSGLIGRITDQSGAGLPGVTVEIRSKDLIGGSRAAATDAADAERKAARGGERGGDEPAT